MFPTNTLKQYHSLEKKERFVLDLLEKTDLSNDLGPKIDERQYWGGEVLYSTGHPFYSKKGFKGEDLGGEFAVMRLKMEVDKQEHVRMIRHLSGKIVSQWTGRIIPAFGGIPQSEVTNIRRHPQPLHTSYADMGALGATAISRCAPTNPNVSLATFLGELREGLPSLVGLETAKNYYRDRKVTSHDISGEYLNYEFGLKPLMSEISEINKTVATANKVLRQYRRDANRLVRRRYTFPTETTESVISVKTGAGALSGAVPTYTPFLIDWGSGARLEHKRKVVSKTWFSGAFRYYLPKPANGFEEAMVKVREFNKLYGIIPGPATFYALAPWSWAIDWVSNLGDNIHNFQAFTIDGLTLPYGYVMNHTTITDTYTLSGLQLEPKYGGRNIPPVSTILSTEIKQRRKASPFGFSLTEEAFSPRQWAILAALGIQRAPSKTVTPSPNS